MNHRILPNRGMALAGLFLSAVTATCFQQGLQAGYYTPEAGTFIVTPSFSFTTFDEFWAGTTESGNPGGGAIDRYSYRLYLNYGITDTLMADLSVGFADVDSALDKQTKLTDTYLGLSSQFLDESTDAIDALGRVGIVIAGNYDQGFLSTPGEGESGFQAMAKFGKTLTANGLRGDVMVDYTYYGGDVPESFTVRGGPTLPLGESGFSLDGSFIYFTKLDGIDIGGPGFTALSDLPKVEEEGYAGELGIAFSSGASYYRVAVSQIFEGRNVGKEFTIGVAGSFKF